MPDSANSGTAVVGIVMGSDSDWPTMKAAAEALEELGIESTAEVVSAHRMPEDMVEWAKTAADRGLRVIIAGAGGAAHLPGMIASMTSLPVIGVPVPLKYLDGMDSSALNRADARRRPCGHRFHRRSQECRTPRRPNLRRR